MADAGRAMMLYRGLYDNTHTYEKLDVVNFNGSLYISTTDGNLGTEPTDVTKWKLFLQGGVSDNIQATDTYGLVGTKGDSSFVQLLLDSLASRIQGVTLNRQTLGYSKKNLLKNILADGTSSYGITFTVDDNKVVVANGTATANPTCLVGTFIPTPNQTYIFTSNTDSFSWNSCCYLENIDGVDEWKVDAYGVPFMFTPTTDEPIKCRIYIAKGTTVENLKFYPMIRSADITDGTYEPYVDDVDTRLQKIDDSILNTLEEIDANTSEENIAGALAIKSLNSKVSDLTNNSGYYLGTTGSLTLGADETITIPDLTDYKFLLFVFNGTYVAEFVPLLELRFESTDKFSRKTVKDGYYFNLKVILVEGGINIKIEEIAGYSYGAVAIYGLK